MAAAVPFLMVAGAAMSAMSAINQGKAAKAAAQYNASIEEQNAQVARDQTLLQVRQADREAYLRLGAQRAAAGASGVKEAGSVLDVIADTAAQNEVQRQDIVYEGSLRQRGYQNAAALDRFSGETAEKNSYLQAGADLLTGAGNAYVANKRLRRV